MIICVYVLSVVVLRLANEIEQRDPGGYPDNSKEVQIYSAVARASSAKNSSVDETTGGGVVSSVRLFVRSFMVRTPNGVFGVLRCAAVTRETTTIPSFTNKPYTVTEITGGGRGRAAWMDDENRCQIITFRSSHSFALFEFENRLYY